MHLTEKQISEYASRILPPAELLLIDDHLIDCADCSHKLSSVLQAKLRGTMIASSIAAELAANGEDFHLEYSQIADYVNQHLDPIELERVSTHLEVCLDCRTATEDVQAFKKTLLSSNSPTANATVSGWHSTLKTLRPNIWWALPIAATAGIILFTLGFFARRQSGLNAQQQSVPSPTVVMPTGMVSIVPSSTPLAVPETSPQLPEERVVQMALTTGHLEFPAELKTLRRKSENLMGEKVREPAFTIIAPQAIIVESEQPRLRWAALPGAKCYVVTVADQDLNEVARSQELTSTNWLVSKKLKRGESYQWQVTATTVTGKEITAPFSSAPEAKFKVLSNESFDLLSRARQRYATSPLELGVIYARVGLLPEAEHEFESVTAPSPIALQLIEQLRQAR